MVAVVVLLFGWGSGPEPPKADDFITSHPNNFPHLNASGFSATFSTQGFVDLTTEYSQAQGNNGRSCQTCHIPQQAWAINPGAIKLLFALTEGTHPIFNPLDANNPNSPPSDFTTVEGRRAAYSTLLNHGLFRRGGAPTANRDWDLIAVDDPNGFACLPGGGTGCPRIVQWRRVMPTINFLLGSATVNWDGGNSVGADQHAGLVNQATRNVTGAQQGQPAPPEVIDNIVAFETSLFTAQIFSFSAGFLNAGGAQGGPEQLSLMEKVQGPFNLFDAWINSPIAGRAKIARGQALFNATNPGGRSCNGCHNSANNGTNINNTLFNVQTASEAVQQDHQDFLPLYTFRSRATPPVEIRLSDTGAGNVTGNFSDLGRFKTPTLRALAARAPYFHNGIAATLEDVVRHYERFLGFIFTDQQREDVVAFLKAL
ncbi:MAG TPA: hypothetical protein VID04_06010 [Methylomirabilota bacterium]